ncbi:MAG: hypothetical protein M1389_12000, partial [Chloroflexi bacterium]|nr:hypothetical protein [Chloroflexota bacterium]
DAVQEFGCLGGETRPVEGTRAEAGAESSQPQVDTVVAGQAPVQEWESVRADFGEIKGDEASIKEKWEELENDFLPFLYWLLK